MNPEVLALKGQLSISRARRMNLDAEASGIITTIRLQLRVGLEPVDVNIDQVRALTARLDTVIAELRVLDKSIKELEQALG